MNLVDDLLEKYSLDFSEFNRIQLDIIELYTNSFKSEKNPTCIILGGQPGSGKTELEKLAFQNLNCNAVVCNVDNLKEFHPKSFEIKKHHPNHFSDLTSKYAHEWNLALRNYCIQNNLNFILETTLNSGDNINKITNNLKRNSYDVDIYLMSVPLEVSKISCYLRYEESLNLNIPSRKVSAFSHDERFNSIPNAIKEVEKEKLYDYIYLYGRTIMDLNYQNDHLNKISLIGKTRNYIYEDFMMEREQPLLKKTRHYIEQCASRVFALMNNRSESKEEIELFINEFEDFLPDKNIINTLKK
jgi:predicted ABC-type ATPase